MVTNNLTFTGNDIRSSNDMLFMIRLQGLASHHETQEWGKYWWNCKTKNLRGFEIAFLN